MVKTFSNEPLHMKGLQMITFKDKASGISFHIWISFSEILASPWQAVHHIKSQSRSVLNDVKQFKTPTFA